MENKEMVQHPSHYNRNGGMETIKKMELLFGWKAVVYFCVLNNYKYLDRDKFNREEDTKKAEWYLNYANQLCAENNATIYDFLSGKVKK